jgi:hypothetical protein
LKQQKGSSAPLKRSRRKSLRHPYPTSTQERSSQTVRWNIQGGRTSEKYERVHQGNHTKTKRSTWGSRSKLQNRRMKEE